MLNIEKLSYWERKTYFDQIDYLVIGAGIVGYSTALHLRKNAPDAKILILERGFLPSGASSKNAGFACFGSATELYSDLKKYNKSVVWDTVKMRWEGLQYLKQIIGTNGLKLKVNGSWDLITDKDIELYNHTKPLLPYFNEKIKDITGEDEVYSIDNEISSKFSFNNVVSSFYNRLEGQIDTASMNHEFYRLMIKENILVLFGIEAQSIENGEVGTNIGILKAKKIAVCTNGFGKEILSDEDVEPARAQVLITKPINGLKIEGTFHYQMGYYYFRNIDNRILFGGGRNLDIKGETTTDFGVTDDIQSSLLDILNNVILPDTSFEIDYCWSGIMGVGETKKPIIKHVKDNVYCGIRLGGMGVAIGTLVGKNLAELIKDEE